LPSRFCSTAGTITPADDLGTQVGSFQDYVIVHELLHLKVPNHGKVFNALHLPGWRRQKRVESSASRDL
jgi:predicted metal-dependent hydrolase